MFFRLIYDDGLAQASYLIGEDEGDAIVFDPQRDVDRYIALAEKHKLRIVGVAETHIHADFVSGARELAERTGAHVYVSGEGGAQWTPTWLKNRSSGGAYPNTVLRDGDEFCAGAVRFRAVHTPGHTPEHMSFLVTDAGAETPPIGALTGDFVFVGDLGRPDLLENAVGVAGAAKPAARQLHESLEWFRGLEDFVQVWPGHGAGSACGKSLGAAPQSTVGYEKRQNALVMDGDEDHFVESILSGQPEPPVYFGRMKRVNVEGPPVLGELTQPDRVSVDHLAELDPKQCAIADGRAWDEFRVGHLPGALSLPVDGTLSTTAGCYIGPDQPIYLIVEEGEVEDALRRLMRVGLDRIAGWAPAGEMRAFAAANPDRLERTKEISAQELAQRLGDGGEFVLDVRRQGEWDMGHIEGARRLVHTQLPKTLGELPRGREIVVNCRSGVRSARACSLLQREGLDAVNLAGGIKAWVKESQA